MFTFRFLPVLIFFASLHAQYSAAPPADDPAELRHFEQNRRPESPFAGSLMTASGEAPLLDEVLGHSDSKPISGVVALRDLQHPVSKKALRQAFDAQRYARANEIPKAIAKLEKAIQIDPSYRDGHLNLGVQYSRVGRIADARAQFQKALEIGPPIAPIYLDLALASLALHQRQEAASFAQKTLQLDPANLTARLVLQNVSQHE